MRFGSWMMPAFRVLAKLKGLRGTALDLFGRTEERRMERALILDYERTVEELLADLTPAKLSLALEIASLPEEIRGYGHVKAKSAVAAGKKQAELLARWRGAATPAVAKAA